MNKVILTGRLSKEIELRYSANGSNAVARTSIAVQRRFKRDGDPEADFFNLVAFGKQAEFLEKYFTKGKMIAIVGHIENDNYTNKDGQKVFGTRITVEECDFCEGKNESAMVNAKPQNNASGEAGKAEGFMNVPDGMDEELPFN